jgi:hypothetical protein
VAKHEPKQRRHDDGPTENADLTEAGAKRGFRFFLCLAFALHSLPCSAGHPVGVSVALGIDIVR